MIETLHDAHGQDATRIKRAFGWVITFRDFPVGSWQTVDAASMMTEALTLFTKGRAEFYLDGVKRRDRVPGILSSEMPYVFTEGEFKLVYVEPTTRLCIPAKINGGKLPRVEMHLLKKNQFLDRNDKFLVCLGSVQCGDRTFVAEQSFISTTRWITAHEDSILLRF